MTTELHPVQLVGAGPGDPQLITLAGAAALRQADVILHDRLASPALLALAADAELINVGKTPYSPHHANPQAAQERIHQLLIQHAQAGRRVVRLKGGDPFVFGRGGEEASALAAAGIPFTIIPGVTSATAAAAAAGIAVTDRRAASAVTILTGREGGGGAPPVNWKAAAQVGGTLVLLMAWRDFSQIAEQLTAGGLSPNTPAAAIERASTPQQQIVKAPLAELKQAAAALRPPVTVVIGNTVALAAEPSPPPPRPLEGRRIVVTRPAPQAAALAQRLQGLGAEPLVFPTIAIAPREDAAVDAAVQQLANGAYDDLILTSPNGVRCLWTALRRLRHDARALHGVRLAAVGAETARTLAEIGLTADLVPSQFTTAALADRLLAEGVQNRRLLLARAAHGSAHLRARLTAAAAQVDDVPLYDTVPPEPSPTALAQLQRWQADERRVLVTLTSPSTAQGWAQHGIHSMHSAEAVCIGPVTALAARSLGLPVAAAAAVHTMDGLVDALCQLCSNRELG